MMIFSTPRVQYFLFCNNFFDSFFQVFLIFLQPCNHLFLHPHFSIFLHLNLFDFVSFNIFHIGQFSHNKFPAFVSFSYCCLQIPVLISKPLKFLGFIFQIFLGFSKLISYGLKVFFKIFDVSDQSLLLVTFSEFDV